MMISLTQAGIFCSCVNNEISIEEPEEEIEEVEEPEENGNESDNQELPTIYYEDNELEGTVAYKRCEIERPLYPIYPLWPSTEMRFPTGEAYLFKDSVPYQKQVELVRNWIILYNRDKKNETRITMDGTYSLPFRGMICNFPDFAKAWDIPEYGCKVYIEDISYLPTFGSNGEVISFDYVLTTLKMN